MSPAADAEAVVRVLEGDVQAFEAIVRRWQGPVVNLAWRYCRDRSQAEDLAQEALLQVYRSLASWRRESAFSTWMFAVATNVIRNRMRQRLPRQVDLDDAPAWALMNDPVAESEQRDLREHVRRGVRLLPARYRDAVIAYYFHDTDIARAAASLGLPSGTLKARLHRARNLLARRLAGVVGRAAKTDGESDG